jgi:hypothetical protein
VILQSLAQAVATLRLASALLPLQLGVELLFLEINIMRLKVNAVSGVSGIANALQDSY